MFQYREWPTPFLVSFAGDHCASLGLNFHKVTTTDKKYTEKIETKTRNKTVEEYTKQLPESLRTRFLELHATITDGKPNHQESLGCPLSGNAEKRLAFQQVARNRLPGEQRKKIYPALVNACKLHNLCTRSGRPRTARNEQQHKQCSAYTKKCPHILRNSCKPFKHVRTPLARSPNHMAHGGTNPPTSRETTA